MRTLAWTALWIFVIDQVIKFVVLYQIFDLPFSVIGSAVDGLPYPERVDVVAPFLVLTMAWNEGINFGLFAGYDLRWALIAIALIICAAVVWWLGRDQQGRWAYLAGGFLVGGALGNVIDRILYGAVADFLNMSCCGIRNPYAFNVADISIFIGAVGLVIFVDDSHKKAS